jgi:hypothetical protein
MTLATLVLGILLQIGRPPRVIRSPLESKARDFVTNFTKSRFDMASKDFNESMRAVVTPSVLAEVKQQSDVNLGAFRSIVMVRQRKAGNFRVVEVVCRFEKSLGTFRVTFDVLDNIGTVYLDPLATEPVEPVLEATARELLKNFVAKDFEAATSHFDRKMQIQLSPSKLAKMQTQVANAYGEFRSVKEVRQITDEPYRTIELIAVYDRSSVSIRIAFNSEDLVTGIRLLPVAPENP